MADDVAITAGVGTTIATDDAGGRHVQIIKLAIATDGSATLIPADANGLLVNLGANNDVTGTVDLGATDNAVLDGIDASLNAIETDAAAIEVLLGTIDADTGAIMTAAQLIDNAISGNEMQVDIVTVPADPFGANADASSSAGGVGTIQAKLRLMTLQLAGIQTAVQLIDDAISGSEMQVDVISLPGAATGTITSVNDSATNVTLLASNAARKGASFYNDSTQVLYLKHAATATTASFTTKLQPDQLYEIPGPTIYTGIVDGIWAADASGACRVTELT